MTLWIIFPAFEIFYVLSPIPRHMPDFRLLLADWTLSRMAKAMKIKKNLKLKNMCLYLFGYFSYSPPTNFFLLEFWSVRRTKTNLASCLMLEWPYQQKAIGLFFFASWRKMPCLLDVGSSYTALLIVPLLTFNYLVKLLYKETQIFRLKPGSSEKNLEPPMGSNAGGRPVWLLQHFYQNITPRCSVAYYFFCFLKR